MHSKEVFSIKSWFCAAGIGRRGLSKCWKIVVWQEERRTEIERSRLCGDGLLETGREEKEEKRSVEPGGEGGVVSRVLREDEVAGRRFFSCRAQGVAEQILRVRRGRPPSAPAFSCSRGLSAGWGLPGEGTAGWEPSRPLWLALLKICQILQCKKKRRRVRSGAVPLARGWWGPKSLVSHKAGIAGKGTDVL